MEAGAMNCKTCGYALWNLQSRTCPECGTAFRPSDFDFAANAVRFCCPHCMQAYYGTDARGHLVPPAFACVSCGRAVSMDEMVLLPAAGVTEQQTEARYHPWLAGNRLGFFVRWWRTVLGAMISPHRLIALRPPDAPTSAAVAFACLTLGVYYLLGLSVPMLFPIGIAAIAGRGAGTVVGVLLLSLLAGYAVLIGLLFLWAGATHVLVAATNPRHAGLAATFEAICYSSGAFILLVIPCLNFYFFWLWAVWWMVSATIMVMVIHRISGWRASFATLTPPLLLYVIGGAIFVYSLAPAMSLAGAVPAAPGPRTRVWSTPTTDTPQRRFAAVRDALMKFRGERSAWPAHGLELVVGGLQVSDLVYPNAAYDRDESATRVNGLPLLDFGVKSRDEQIQIARTFASGFPERTAAHRVGDVVFTYHGIDAGDPDPALWLLVMCPPKSDPRAPASARRYVVPVDGKPMVRTPEEFAADLAAQNMLRAAHGLPPLPDPAGVDVAEGVESPP